MIAPRRIQRSRAKGWRMPEGAVYVGRPTGWGNPFAHSVPAIGVRMFRAWLLGTCRGIDLLECRVVASRLHDRRRAILQSLGWLAGRDLACWCRLDQPCHADVLLELANAPLRCEGV